MSFLAILEVLNFDFSKFEQLSSPKCTKIAKNDIFGQFELAKTISRKIGVAVKSSNFDKVKP